MRKIVIYLLTLTVLLLVSTTPVFANGEVNISDKASSFSEVESNELSKVENEVSPLWIPCPYYDSSHRYVATGSRSEGRSGGSEQVTIKKSDGSTHVVTCNITNWYTVTKYYCACGDNYENGGTFSRTTHSVSH
ncbi:hypothetical protein [Psychrobacillus sp. FJAT-21963]|uniref:hypothetical protein n=1 Tax=Psychrobacillus sp. FJAT-21963 TaxID=1712028 RepID=UPI0007017AE1|nr:hypothetical protein [Psychrobacillus sp. FJAT-21963]KQL12395.1 hypothetical protein AN959_20485 [Psychrobacillus sp. FJAT-21963]